MKLAKNLSGMAAACLFVQFSANADIILIEDFEDSNVSYQASNESLLDLDNNDYFGRLNQDQLPSAINYSNVQGSSFFAVQDTDGAQPNAVDDVWLYWQDIDISLWQNLSLSWFIAEDDSNDGNEDIDQSTRFELAVQIDKGGFTPLFSVTSSGGTNNTPAVDTNFDGTGNGIEITDTFQQFSHDIALGSLLDIEVKFLNFDASDEDFAFDHLALTGDAKSQITKVSEPSSAILLGLTFFMLVSCKRR